MTAFIITVLCGGALIAGIPILLMVLAPIVYAAAYAKEEQQKQDISDALKIARMNKIKADQEVLESRRALIDSNVAIKELQAEALREKLGYTADPERKRNQFNPINYK